MKIPTSLDTYEARLAQGQAEIVRRLRRHIEAALPDAASKVWHGHPVWFDGENPIVGYDARKATVNILFWNGQAFAEPDLVAVGKYRAAGAQFTRAAEIDAQALRRWLEKARTNVFDSVTHFQKLREAAKPKTAITKAPRSATSTTRRRR